VFKSRFFDLYEMIPGFLVGMGLTIGVSLFTDPPEGAATELDSVRRARSRQERATTTEARDKAW
jgi:Na+/proline symporter